MSQKSPFKNGTSHRDSISTPWNRPKLEKNHFLRLKTSFLAQIYPPPPLHVHSFEVNKKIVCSIFETSHFKHNCSNPSDESILLNSGKMCPAAKNKKSPSLEVLDRAVLELWSII